MRANKSLGVKMKQKVNFVPENNSVFMQYITTIDTTTDNL